jgi:hypothetical protein
MTGEHLESEGKIVEVPVSISYTALLSVLFTAQLRYSPYL